jgi:nucleoside-diphosphate-sugar epimerase
MTYGSARSLTQMIEILRSELPNIVVNYQPRDQLMPERGTLNMEKARRLIGFVPQWPLEKGFVRYIQWYKDLAERHPEFFRVAK